MKFDYCTMLANREEMELLPLHLNSLLHFHPNDEFNIKICVPEDKEIIECCKNFPNADIEILVLPTFPHYGLLGNGHRQVGYDCANRMDKLMQICDAEWVVMSHLDVIYEGQMFQEIKDINNKGEYGDVGLVGHHPNGVFVLNRKAYFGCNCKFFPIGGGFVGKKIDAYTVLLCGMNDILPGERPVSIIKTDVGDVLEVEMQITGYRILPLNNYYFHIGGQGFYGKGEVDKNFENKAHARKQEALNKYVRFK